MKKISLAIVVLLLALCVSISLVACNNDKTFDVQFDANGGTGAMQTLQIKQGEEKALTANAFIKENFAFAGWSTTANGEVEYADEAKFSPAKNTILYAVWTRVAYSVRFNANGGSGEMSPLPMPVDGQQTLSPNAFSRPNYTFTGWATSANGTVIYADRASISVDSDTELFAVWTRNSITATVTAQQKAEQSKITAAWSQASEKIHKVELSAFHGDELVASKTLTAEADITAGAADLDVYWGKYNVKVKIFGDDDTVFAEYTQNVNVSTDKYNIAFMYATFPVSIFTLQMMDADSADVDSTAETFVHLSRYRAYDWDNLPLNMKPIPVAMPGEDGTDPYNNTKDWIKELYDMNNDAQFTLYFNDLYVNIICHFFIENNIPLSNWNAIMYSDGTATANCIVQAFNIDDPATKYNQMATAWNAYLDNPSLGRNSLPDNGGWNMGNYAYVVCNEMDNVKWYTGRLRTTENVILQNADFANTVVNGSKDNGRKEFYLNNLLAALTPEEKATFKTLYSIDENTFEAANTQNKKVMMILGTSWGGEGAALEDYLRITMEVYGDDYVYYYKGHPGYPTSSYAGRKAILDRLVEEGYALYELDNSVAAEFFLFFFEDIEMIGYSSTTFESGTDANADGVFGKNLASGYYSDWLETYISKIADNAAFNASYADKGISLNATGNYYLIEFQKDMATDKNIAIYDAASKTVAYYKLVGETYQLIA